MDSLMFNGENHLIFRKASFIALTTEGFLYCMDSLIQVYESCLCFLCLKSLTAKKSLTLSDDRWIEVNSLMWLQISFCFVWFPTNITKVGFLSSMNSLMVGQVCLVWKCLLTESTQEVSGSCILSRPLFRSCKYISNVRNKMLHFKIYLTILDTFALKVELLILPTSNYLKKDAVEIENSEDLDQTAPLQLVWLSSALFYQNLYKYSIIRITWPSNKR